jgi:RNA polymerase sigma-70 factor (ECF subfamily)
MATYADAPTEPTGKPGSAGARELVEQNLGWLRGWLGARLSGRHRQEVDDLCQEVALHALRGAERLRSPERLVPWLYRIAANVLNDYLRSRARRQPMSALSENVPERTDFSARIEEDEEARRLLDLVLELPPRYREPLLLRHAQDLSYAEIARILGLKENAVQVRIFRAREALRALRERRANERPQSAGLRPPCAEADRVPGETAGALERASWATGTGRPVLRSLRSLRSLRKT